MFDNKNVKYLEILIFFIFVITINEYIKDYMYDYIIKNIENDIYNKCLLCDGYLCILYCNPISVQMTRFSLISSISRNDIINMYFYSILFLQYCLWIVIKCALYILYVCYTSVYYYCDILVSELYKNYIFKTNMNNNKYY